MNGRTEVWEERKKFKKARGPSTRGRMAGQVGRRQIWKSLVH